MEMEKINGKEEGGEGVEQLMHTGVGLLMIIGKRDGRGPGKISRHPPHRGGKDRDPVALLRH